MNYSDETMIYNGKMPVVIEYAAIPNPEIEATQARIDLCKTDFETRYSTLLEEVEHYRSSIAALHIRPTIEIQFDLLTGFVTLIGKPKMEIFTKNPDDSIWVAQVSDDFSDIAAKVHTLLSAKVYHPAICLLDTL